MRLRKACIMVEESHTLISSWVLKRDRSWLDFRTAKMGNSNSWQTVSQNSTVKVEPYVFNVEKSESSALSQVSKVTPRRAENAHNLRTSKSSPFMITS